MLHYPSLSTCKQWLVRENNSSHRLDCTGMSKERREKDTNTTELMRPITAEVSACISVFTWRKKANNTTDEMTGHPCQPQMYWWSRSVSTRGGQDAHHAEQQASKLAGPMKRLRASQPRPIGEQNLMQKNPKEEKMQDNLTKKEEKKKDGRDRKSWGNRTNEKKKKRGIWAGQGK